MSERLKKKQLSEAHRDHSQKIEELRSQGASSRDIDTEYALQLKRVARILGDDDETGDRPCIGSGGRTY